MVKDLYSPACQPASRSVWFGSPILDKCQAEFDHCVANISRHQSRFKDRARYRFSRQKSDGIFAMTLSRRRQEAWLTASEGTFGCRTRSLSGVRRDEKHYHKAKTPSRAASLTGRLSDFGSPYLSPVPLDRRVPGQIAWLFSSSSRRLSTSPVSGIPRLRWKARIALRVRGPI